jgi:hypothetical protein
MGKISILGRKKFGRIDSCFMLVIEIRNFPFDHAMMMERDQFSAPFLKKTFFVSK